MRKDEHSAQDGIVSYPAGVKEKSENVPINAAYT